MPDLVIGRAFLAAFALLLPAAALAQDNVRPVDETAADLAYGLCLPFISGQLPLTDAQLSSRGFGPEVETAAGTRFGDVQTVKATLTDGTITFGGTVGKVCAVTVEGPKLDAVADTLKKNMAFMGLDFQSAASPTPVPPTISVETFKAEAGGQFLYVQILRTKDPKPLVSAQLFVTDK
jgi:hypothetical protein